MADIESSIEISSANVSTLQFDIICLGMSIINNRNKSALSIDLLGPPVIKAFGIEPFTEALLLTCYGLNQSLTTDKKKKGKRLAIKHVRREVGN